MKKLSKFIHLSYQHKILLLLSFTVLACIKLGLLILPFKLLQRWLVWMSQLFPKSGQSNVINVKDILWSVDLSSRYMPGGAKCLARALAGQFLMNRNGYKSKLCIGVSISTEEGFKAHAWLEQQSQIVIGEVANIVDFHQLVALPEEPRQPVNL